MRTHIISSEPPVHSHQLASLPSARDAALHDTLPRTPTAKVSRVWHSGQEDNLAHAQSAFSHHRREHASMAALLSRLVIAHACPRFCLLSFQCVTLLHHPPITTARERPRDCFDHMRAGAHSSASSHVQEDPRPLPCGRVRHRARAPSQFTVVTPSRSSGQKPLASSSLLQPPPASFSPLEPSRALSRGRGRAASWPPS